MSGVLTCMDCGRVANLAAPPRSRASDWTRWRVKYGVDHGHLPARSYVVGHVCPRCSDPA